jgi:hypothetical protein
MIVALALATHTAPSQWWDEDGRVIVTALDLLAEEAERVSP